MRKESTRKNCCGLLFGGALVALLLSAYEAPPLAAQGGNAPSAKNPYVAALEKKIAGQENEPADKVFKNLQPLKALPAGRLLRVMEVAFSASLGVDCTHCHLPEQWEKDDKEAKQTARKMWQFTNTVNQELKQALGKGTVNCTTCHRGQVKPALSLTPPK